LRNRGLLSEAMKPLRVARAEDPASAVVLSQVAYGYYLNRQMDSALAESRRALQNDPANRGSVGNGALIALGANLPVEARALADRPLPAFLIKEYVIAKSGDPDAARQGLQKLDAETPQPWMAETRRAYAYLGLGDTAKALSAMERALHAGEDWPGPFSLFDPMFDPVRKSARFRALLRRIGLAP